MAGNLLCWGFTPTTFAVNTHPFPSIFPDISFNPNLNYQQNQQSYDHGLLRQDMEDPSSFFSGFQFGLPYPRVEDTPTKDPRFRDGFIEPAAQLAPTSLGHGQIGFRPVPAPQESESTSSGERNVDASQMSAHSSQEFVTVDGFKAHDLMVDLTLEDDSKSLDSVKRKKPKFDEISFDDIRFEEKIGEGSFGEVYRGFLWGQEVALKKLRIKGTTDNIKEFRKELKIMRTLRHPNIVEFLGACVEPNRMCIVTEYLANGSLEDVLERNAKRKKRISIKRIVALAKDIARGLNWLHHKGIIHRDLKTANILVDSSGKGKLADFGLSHIKSSSGDPICGTYGVVGTPCYMAPEVLQKNPYGVKADIFSFAIVLCEMILGKYPYDNEPESTATFEKAIVSGLRPDVPACIPAMQNLIVSCWAENPDDRPAMDQIMDALERMEQDLNRTAMDARSLSLLEELPEEVQKLFEEERKRNNLLQSIIDQQKEMLAVAQREIF